MEIKKYLTGALVGIGLGILANSYDTQTSARFQFENPVPINSTLEEQLEIVSKRPYMVDTWHSLDFFGNKIPLKTTRAVINPVTGENFQGRLDKNENIHTEKGVYKLQSAHDSNWYSKE
ncbi:MAG: hypothetical protein ABIF88_04205 [archaeon]